MNNFLKNLDTPSISKELNLELDKPFILEEVVNSLQSIAKWQTPRP